MADIIGTGGSLRDVRVLGICIITGGLIAGSLVAGTAPQAMAAESAGPKKAETLAQVVAQGSPTRDITLNIPAQPLDSALTAFADQAGLRLLFTSEAVAGREAPALDGTFTPGAALGRLLQGTGLTWRYTEGDTVVIAAETPRDDSTSLGAITVLGTRRSGAPISNVPSSISVIEQEEVRKQRDMSPRIEDILARTVPGVNPTNNGVRNIRGRTAQVFLNGVPVNEQLRASSGSDLNLVSPDQLQGIEVSRGANSAYGFGSPGGIISLSTPRAQSPELEFNTVVRESFNPHRIGGSHQTSLYQSAAQIVDEFDFHVGGSLAYDGTEYDPAGNRAYGFDNSALLTNGRETLANFDGSFGWDLGRSGKLRFTGTFGHVDFIERYEVDPGTYRGPYGTMETEPGGGDSFRTAYTGNVTYENSDVLGSALKLELFASDVYTEVHSEDSGTNYRDEQTNEYHGFRSSLTSNVDALPEGSTITYGFDYISNRYFRPNYNDDTGALDTYYAPDVTLKSYAGYAQLEVPLGDFILSGGFRHEEYRGSAETSVGSGGITGGDIDPFDLTLYNAGLVYFVDDATELYGTFSQGAEVTQLGRAARSASSADQIDPQPAKSDQYELGVRHERSGTKLTLAAFYTESDLISSLECDGTNPCTPLREPRQFWGVEGTADWMLNQQWNIGGVLTWQDGLRNTGGGNEKRIGMRDLPPLLVTAYVDYRPYDWWRNTLQANYRGSRDPFGDSTSYGEGSVDSLILLNASTALKLDRGELRFGIENLLNTEYTSIPAEASNSEYSWVPEEGRRVTISYALKW